MGYVTENKLKAIIDLPVALPSTTVKQGDYLVVATVKLVAPQRLSLRSLSFQMAEANVDTDLIGSTNKVVPNLGLAYVVLRKDFVSGTPGSTGSLDFLKLDSVAVVTRSTVPAFFTAPGNYSIICANNMQAAVDSEISPGVSIDFKLVVTGQFRLELANA